jgi:hypothetical protein
MARYGPIFIAGSHPIPTLKSAKKIGRAVFNKNEFVNFPNDIGSFLTSFHTLHFIQNGNITTYHQ